eukprot:5058657-Pleurochrysis_carterae.AAC.2
MSAGGAGADGSMQVDGGHACVGRRRAARHGGRGGAHAAAGERGGVAHAKGVCLTARVSARIPRGGA